MNPKRKQVTHAGQRDYDLDFGDSCVGTQASLVTLTKPKTSIRIEIEGVLN